jgi:hypothetical protein
VCVGHSTYDLAVNYRQSLRLDSTSLVNTRPRHPPADVWGMRDTPQHEPTAFASHTLHGSRHSANSDPNARSEVTY